MGIYYNYRLSSLPLFLFDAQTESAYISNAEGRNIIGGRSTTIKSVNITGSGLSRNYTFTNPTNGFNASSSIKYTPDPSEYSNYFLNLSGCAAFVTFKNTSLLSSSAPSYFRQTPFSVDTDSGLGAWNFERFYTNSSYALRVKFDQDGTYGFTRNFGDVDLNVLTQLGFMIRNSRLLLYKNGEVVDDIDISSKTLAAPRENRSLGVGASNGDIYGFIGEIYNAAWWNTSLSDDEVRLFYNQTIGRY